MYARIDQNAKVLNSLISSPWIRKLVEIKRNFQVIFRRWKICIFVKKKLEFCNKNRPKHWFKKRKIDKNVLINWGVAFEGYSNFFVKKSIRSIRKDIIINFSLLKFMFKSNFLTKLRIFCSIQAGECKPIFLSENGLKSFFAQPIFLNLSWGDENCKTFAFCTTLM